MVKIYILWIKTIYIYTIYQLPNVCILLSPSYPKCLSVDGKCSPLVLHGRLFLPRVGQRSRRPPGEKPDSCCPGSRSHGTCSGRSIEQENCPVKKKPNTRRCHLCCLLRETKKKTQPLCFFYINMYNLMNGQRCKVQHPGQCLVISTVVQCVKRNDFIQW